MKPTTDTNRDEKLSNQPKYTQGELKVLKLSDDEIIITADVKSSPLRGDDFSQPVREICKMLDGDKEANAQRIVKAVNGWDKANDLIQRMLVEVSPAFNFDMRKAEGVWKEAQEFIKQAEGK